MTLQIWEEPVRGVWAHPAVTQLSGLEASRRYVDGSLPLPPIGRLTGLRPTDSGQSHSSFVLPVTAWLQNPSGHLTPASAALVCDAPLGQAFFNGLPPGKVCTTTELSINYLRPADLRAQQLIARAEVIKAGHTTGLTQAQILDAHGRMLAHATSRLVVLDVPIATGMALPEPQPFADDDPWLREARGGVMPHEMWDSHTGRQILAGWISGDIVHPPIHFLTGAAPIAINDDNVVWTMPASEWLCSPGPALYGGALALLADAALLSAVMPNLPAGVVLSPMDLRMRFIRPVIPGSGLLTATATVVHQGKGLAVTQCEIRTADGKVAVLAESALLLRPTGS